MNRLGVAALALLLAAHGCAADDQTTTMEERRLMKTTIAETPDDVSGAVARSGSLGTVLLALLAFLFVGNAAGAAVDESTTMADERRLMDTTTAGTPDDVSAAPRAAIWTTPVFAIAAALGVTARR
jgi:hypothetical protein